MIRNFRYGLRNTWLVKITGAALITVVVGIIGTTVLFAFFAKDLPSPDKVVRREGFSTKILDRSGSLLYDVYGDQRRTPVNITDIPLVMRQATISIEDKSFYKHTGFDPLTPLRIVWNMIIRHRVVGGSTLTQQLVKNSMLTLERTITRKLKEFILTVQVERKYTKDQILQMYLNEVPYGGTAWGVEAAAEMYFGKPISQVNLAEAAVLAGLPQSPTYYSPFVGTAYVNRAYEVLRRMREDGYINKTQEVATQKEIKELQFASSSGTLKAPHFVFYVKQLLVDRYGESVVDEGGLKVTTTLDLPLQEVAQTAVTEEIAKVKSLKITNGAAIALDPKNGQILAMVGSKGWDEKDYEGKFNVVTASRQPGSAIKPLVYLSGLQKGYTAATLLMDTKTSFPGGDKPEYAPENYDGKFRGPILVREALGNSINVPAVKMLSLVGVRDFLQIAYDMGLSTLKPTKETLDRVGLSVALGGGEVKLIELAEAYAAFANGGLKQEPVVILKVTDKDGKVLEEWKPGPARQVIAPEEAFIISSILSDPKSREITFGPRSLINIPNKTVAVKTGTTNDRRDNWTIGWTPSVLVGVWVGNNDNTPMKEVASGVTGAAPIWRKILLEMLKTKSDEPFGQPAGVVTADVDKISGFMAHDGFEAKKEYFVKGTEPTGEDTVHKNVRTCNGDMKEYFFFKESDPFEKNGINKWQEGIDNWLKEQGDEKYHPPSGSGCQVGDVLWLTIAEPTDKSQVDSNDVKIRVNVTSPGTVNKMEFYVDGDLKQTLTSGPWEVIVNMSIGSNHKIDIKARDDKGNEGSRFVTIGVKQPWAEAIPTP